jgi:hypothetical protein
MVLPRVLSTPNTVYTFRGSLNQGTLKIMKKVNIYIVIFYGLGVMSLKK